MSVTKNGVSIVCEECGARQMDEGVFEINVPMVLDARRRGVAILLCDLRGTEHKIEFQRWEGADGPPSAEDRQRILTALDGVARYNACGTERVCPGLIALCAAGLAGHSGDNGGPGSDPE